MSLLYSFFAGNQQIPFKLFKQKSTLRNVTFLKLSFSLVICWSGNHLGIPIYMVQSTYIIVLSAMCIKLQVDRGQLISSC